MKFFFAQDAEMRVDELVGMVRDEFEKSHVKWFVIGLPITHAPIQEFVDSHYTLVATGKDCQLYRLNEDIDK